MKAIALFLISGIFLCSCSKEDDSTSALSADPVIGFVSISPEEVENFNNSVTLTISYKDNNGDLGFDDPDAYALYVKDSRLDSADWYHVPPLAPPGKNLIIRGQLEIVFNSIFILGNGDEEAVSLTIKMRDRANHWSNIIYTPAIVVKRSIP